MALLSRPYWTTKLFKWVIENDVEYIEEHYDAIESDMNSRNSTSKRRKVLFLIIQKHVKSVKVVDFGN